MQVATFGSRLTEARNRLGISIRQASEVLKIKSDYLISFEEDNGNFDMPLIYKKGFLKIYCRYLKIDPDLIISEFLSYHGKPDPKSLKRDPKEDTPPPPSPSSYSTQSTKSTSQRPSSNPDDKSPLNLKPSDPLQPEPSRKSPPPSPTLKPLYFKTGIIVAGSLVLLTLLAFLISKLFLSSPHSSSTSNESPSIASYAPEDVILFAEAEIHVVIRQENDKKSLFSGNIKPGSPITVSRQGPIKIHFSNGSKLIIQKSDGQRVRPGRDGIGWIQV